MLLSIQDKNDEFEQYMAECEKDWRNYTGYCAGFEIDVQRKRAQGILKYGKTTVNIYGTNYEYSGDLDERGNAYGYGTAMGT